MIKRAILVLAAAAIATPAAAQEQGDISAKMLACRDIDRDKSRLKCFDAIVNEVFGESPELQERRAQTREAEFGLPDATEDEGENELAATIARVESDPQRIMTVIYLDNGQVWQTTSTGNLRRGLKEGAKVTIRPGMIGGFRIYVEGKTGFRGVKRVR